MPRTTNPATPRPGADRHAIPQDRWPEPARLRLEYAGRWVAWAEDGRLIADADDFEAVREAARRAGVEQPVCEWLPPIDQARTVGGA
ncbi:DUF5678 domain-containing protein [Tautonia plasticadhaerens]|uniref:DUF5678 domain-containing protein n=1 Tax=Tautonia plasticadhaerens TaxID=2527974 RepID=A0A518GUK1_9BACT|nr:DUF5678 domain-containing protein [Tautonia plasticadhaerens]QDV32266.1 hypothetical protein ElP_00890 [Tautonia plasticadhaerens]